MLISYLIYFNLIVIKLLFIIVEVDYFINICVVWDIWSKFCKQVFKKNFYLILYMDWEIYGL